MRARSLAWVLAGAVGLFAAEALACSCVSTGEEREALRALVSSSAAVFRGKVTHVSRFSEGSRAYRRITYEVSQSWKGPTTTGVEIATAADGAACGVNAEVGIEYLVLARVPDEGEVRATPYLAGLCGGTRSMDAIPAEWLAFLADQPELPLEPHTGCSSTGLGLSVLPLLALGGWLRRRRV